MRRMLALLKRLVVGHFAIYNRKEPPTEDSNLEPNYIHRTTLFLQLPHRQVNIMQPTSSLRAVNTPGTPHESKLRSDLKRATSIMPRLRTWAGRHGKRESSKRKNNDDGTQNNKCHQHDHQTTQPDQQEEEILRPKDGVTLEMGLEVLRQKYYCDEDAIVEHINDEYRALFLPSHRCALHHRHSRSATTLIHPERS